MVWHRPLAEATPPTNCGWNRSARCASTVGASRPRPWSITSSRTATIRSGFGPARCRAYARAATADPRPASRSVAMTRASGQTDGRQTPGIRCTDVRGRASDKVDGFERKKLRRKRGSARERRGGVATRQPLVNIAPSGNQNDIGCRRISNTSLCRRRHQPRRPRAARLLLCVLGQLVVDGPHIADRTATLVLKGSAARPMSRCSDATERA